MESEFKLSLISDYTLVQHVNVKKEICASFVVVDMRAMRATRKCAVGQIWLAGHGLRTAGIYAIFSVLLQFEYGYLIHDKTTLLPDTYKLITEWRTLLDSFSTSPDRKRYC